MSYTQYELRAIQKVEIEILKEIMNICNKFHIEFFIIGGTALGAQRHKGFIPWDDDIDIGMTRINYEKFIEVCKGNLSNDYFLQTPETDKNTPFAYVKLRKTNTKFVEWRNRNINMNNGIFVDIFPYDNIPNDEKLRKKQFNAVKILNKFYAYSKTPDISEEPTNYILKIKQYIRRFIYYIFKLIPSKIILQLLDNQLKKYNNNKTDAKACLFFPEYMKEYMDNKTLYPISQFEFEDMIVPGPGNIDIYLKNHYGEYMKLPPEEKRVGHRPYIIQL